MRDFDLDPAWQKEVFTRRGGLGADTFVPLPKAEETVQREIRVKRPRFVAEGLVKTPDRDLREQAQQGLDDPAVATPLGAAAVAVLTQAYGDHTWRTVPFADAWIAGRGVRFAVEAAVELAGLADRRPGNHVTALKPGQQQKEWMWSPHPQTILRVRSALAATPEPEYGEIIGFLARQRSRHVYHRLATSLLAPEQDGWVEEDIADTIAADDAFRALALSQAVNTREQLRRMERAGATGWGYSWALGSTPGYLITMIDGLGADALDLLLDWLDTEAEDADRRRLLLAGIGAIPTLAARQALAERAGQRFVPAALLEAGKSHPGLTVRALADTVSRPLTTELLRDQVLGHREAAADQLPDLSPVAAARVRAILDEAPPVVGAPPALLASPPWLERARAAGPVVITGLTDPGEPTVTWLDGEREQYARTDFWMADFDDTDENWAQRAEALVAGRLRWGTATRFFTGAPEDIARSVLPEWVPEEYDGVTMTRPVVARFGVATLPALLRRARKNPVMMLPVFDPLCSPELATQMADWLDRLRTARGPVTNWLHRHPVEAARALIPPALGQAGKARNQAENALSHLALTGHADAVREAATGYGPEAPAAVEILIARDPLTVLPARIPANPPWASPELLPPVRLRDGSGALPRSAVEHLVTMFAISRLDRPYAGLDVARETLDTGDLARFAWRLFRRWYLTGAVAKDNWALDAVGLAGDDEAVRELTPLILGWPGESQHQRAVAGVEVLAAIGTDVALMHLNTIAQRAKFKGLKGKAQEKMAVVAAGRGLTAEQLADRLVPTLGLDDDGSLRLDYGSRQFVVGFDEQLRPYVLDGTGKRLKSLPKPGVKDDAELAPVAYQRFSALKKDVRRISGDLITRLERAMVTGRRWSGAEFRELFVGHPLLRHVVGRLVWGVYDGDLVSSLRVAEDRTFADADDEQVLLADDAVVGVVHPLHLGDRVKSWAEVFADYEILQPFPQLARPVFTLTGNDLSRFDGAPTSAAQAIGLERRGWRREDPMDSGWQGSLRITFPSGVEGSIGLDPGIIVGDLSFAPDQTLCHLHLTGDDAVAISEIVRDLTDITGRA